MKLKFLMSLVVFASIFATLISFAPIPATGLTEEVFTQTNKFRKSRGKPALIMRDELNTIARRHSENMARGTVGFGHGGFNSRYNEARRKISGAKSFAENVAYGASTGREVVNDWKNSNNHRKNMLGSYRYIGIGTAKDRKGRVYYTQVFVD